MRTYFDCIPCFLHQVLSAARRVTDDEVLQERVLRAALRWMSEMDLTQSPPAMGRVIHRAIREVTGNTDPYRDLKARFNQLALSLYPELREKVANSADPFETAVRLVIAGNVIDFGANRDLVEANVHEAIEAALSEPIDRGAVKDLRSAISEARDILYLGDNAGEIVFDRLLIERMPCENVTYVVKGKSVMDDATMVDAETTGMTDLVEVIENGADTQGTILELCSPEFLDRFDGADLVIAKGQANYETLNDVSKRMFFLLRVKCQVVAESLASDVGRTVIVQSKDSTGQNSCLKHATS